MGAPQTGGKSMPVKPFGDVNLALRAAKRLCMTPIALPRIEQAANRIAGHAVRTPLLSSPMLDRRLGAKVFVKAEPLQRTGSFKFRGAMNKILSLSEAERRNGVVAFSSGNHGHAIAAAASIVGIPAAIVMPRDAPSIKIESCRYWGAEVVLYDRMNEDREAIGRRIQEERGMALAPPFDDPEVMAGQGTMGLEIAADLVAAGVVPDMVLVPCSGGGLASGVATAMRAHFPSVASFTVEPAGFDKMARSLKSGTAERNARPAGSLMDALTAPAPGKLTLAQLQAVAANGVTASDEEGLAAMAMAFSLLKLVVDPLAVTVPL